jgi:riboflavin kinase/FMN adenylyltransferase
VHLFEFAQQIYGKHLRVEFLQKLRDEQKFDGLDALTRQIALDIENAKKWFIEHE